MITEIESEIDNQEQRNSDPTFSHIQCIFDEDINKTVVKLQMGEYYVTTQDEVISTTLGSCVSACVRDVNLNLGGMNHYMLPEKKNSKGILENKDLRYGCAAMKCLIDHILKLGGNKSNLEIKIFGGGRIASSMMNIGEKNIEFINQFMLAEGFEAASMDVGMEYPRKIKYFPKTGRVMLKRLRSIHKKLIAQHDLQELTTMES